METLILASESCDIENEVVCAPANVLELFDLPTWFHIGGLEFSRSTALTFLAAFLVVFILWLGLRKPKLVPGKIQLLVEDVIGFVRDGIARDIIGPESTKYVPYLLSLFMFILVGNLFEVVPVTLYPITSRMAIPALLSLLTYIIFVFVGFKKNGIRYFTDIAWPKSVPVALRPLVGLIEVVSTFLLRPLTLAVRLFANLVAGHLMLTLMLGSAAFFVAGVGDVGIKAGLGVIWFGVGIGIYLFEIVVAMLQAYIFTLLSAVYIQTSVHPEH